MVRRALLLKERVVVTERTVVKGQVDGRGTETTASPLATALSFGNRTLFTTTLPFLSSRAKPRDLQFRGPFVEMFFG